MKERYPEYYESFQCIAGECEDTCCAGWEIDIDDESYERYMKVGGSFGERLKGSIKTYEASETLDEAYEQHGFILTEDMRCPFLDEHGLCELYTELGGDALCEVCTHTPRYYLEYAVEGDDGYEIVRETAISASCPEAARLIYADEGRMRIKTRELSDDESFGEDPEELAQEAGFGRYLSRVKDESIEILQDRNRPLHERIVTFLEQAERVQSEINNMVQDDTGESAAEEMSDTDEKYQLFLLRMRTYSGLASIGQAWADRMHLMYELFVGDDEDGAGRYEEAISGLERTMRDQKREYEYEHLLVYYAWLLLGRTIDDQDYLSKARLVVMSFLMNRDMDAAVFIKKGSFDRSDRLENARIYAREIEHAEENLSDLSEEILFSKKSDFLVPLGVR